MFFHIEAGHEVRGPSPPRQLLTLKNTQSRTSKPKEIMNWLESHGSTVRIFFDKKLFTADQAYNWRNDRWVSKAKDDIKCTKHPVSVIMLGIVESNSSKMPPCLFGTRD